MSKVLFSVGGSSGLGFEIAKTLIGLMIKPNRAFKNPIIKNLRFKKIFQLRQY